MSFPEAGQNSHLGDLVIEEVSELRRSLEGVIVEGDELEALPRRAIRMDDGSIELALRFPIVLKIKSGQSGEVREDRTEKLLFRRMKGSDLFDAQAQSGRFMQILMARSTGLSEAKVGGLLKAMDASDALAATAVISIFTGSGQPTGL